MPAKGSGLPRETRFWSHVNKNGPIVRPELGPCWVWTAAVDKDGYGLIYSKELGGLKKAHRVAYILFKGPIPEGLCVLHTCDNPPCVNPNHLWTGTNRNNIDDMVAKGRSLHGKKGTKTKLTEEQVLKIRKLYVPRKGGTPPGVSRKFCYIGSVRWLAKEFGVCRSTIQFILHGRNWNKLKP